MESTTFKISKLIDERLSLRTGNLVNVESAVIAIANGAAFGKVDGNVKTGGVHG